MLNTGIPQQPGKESTGPLVHEKVDSICVSKREQNLTEVLATVIGSWFSIGCVCGWICHCVQCHILLEGAEPLSGGSNEASGT